MSEKIAALIEEVKGLSVLELSELVHALEETFGVSAAAAAVAAPAAGAAEAAEEKTEFDVVLKECGANKIAVIKVGSRFQGRCREDRQRPQGSRRYRRDQVRYPLSCNLRRSTEVLRRLRFP